MYTFPTLYKKTNTGAIQYWTILVSEGGMAGKPAASIQTEYGQLNTDSPQYTTDIIANGKNVGKKNETTPAQQAKAEAQSKWEKQKKKGYVESIASAEAKEVDALIQGGIEPMLAQAFSKHGGKIKYPCFLQPKLDGIRCIAIIDNGKCTLWSRTRKQITSMPHIVEELESVFCGDDVTVLDGELYNHDFKSNFEHIVSLVRQEEPDPRHKDVQYHIYDTISEPTYQDRYADLREIFEVYVFDTCVLVETMLCMAEDGIEDAFDQFRSAGYEGAMVRNRNGSQSQRSLRRKTIIRFAKG